MTKFNFKPGDRVKLSDGSEHTFLIDRRTLASPNRASNLFPYMTMDEEGNTRSFDAEGVNFHGSLRLLPPEDWKYGFICFDAKCVKSFTAPTAADAISGANRIRTVPALAFRVDFGRGAIEQLEDDDV